MLRGGYSLTERRRERKSASQGKGTKMGILREHSSSEHFWGRTGEKKRRLRKERGKGNQTTTIGKRGKERRNEKAKVVQEENMKNRNRIKYIIRVPREEGMGRATNAAERRRVG